MQTDPSSDSAGAAGIKAAEHRDVTGGHRRRSCRCSHWSERGGGREREALGPRKKGASPADALHVDVRPETRLRCWDRRRKSALRSIPDQVRHSTVCLCVCFWAALTTNDCYYNSGTGLYWLGETEEQTQRPTPFYLVIIKTFLENSLNFVWRDSPFMTHICLRDAR